MDDNTVRVGALVVGKGPAGIQAAIHLSRAGVGVLVVAHGAGSLSSAGLIENYYGLREPVSGPELLRIGEAQAHSLGVDIMDSQIVGLGYADDGGYVARTPEREILARTILIATGSRRVKPPVTGIGRLEGKGVSYCAVCDGFLYRQKRVGVLGNADYALSEAVELSALIEGVTIFTNGAEPVFKAGSGTGASGGVSAKESAGFEVVTEAIESLDGADRLEGVRFKNGGFRALDALFVAYGTAGSQELARKLGVLLNRDGDIVTDAEQKTNVPGVFAAGDCTGVFRQVAVAVGQGALAARSIAAYLRM